MADAERRSLLAACRRQRFSKGDAVFREGESGESLHFLAEGTVAVRISTPLGDVVTLDVIRPGEAFGEQALFAKDSTRSATVVALEPVQTLRLERGEFDRLLATHPGVLRLLVEILDARLRATSQARVEALYLPVESRVYRALAKLSVVYANRDAIPLTQDDLASMVGTTRQSLNKVLRQAQDDGLLTLARGQISVTDPNAVSRLGF
jgi:CRP-like cAMP-binding protein